MSLFLSSHANLFNLVSLFVGLVTIIYSMHAIISYMFVKNREEEQGIYKKRRLLILVIVLISGFYISNSAVQNSARISDIKESLNGINIQIK